MKRWIGLLALLGALSGTNLPAQEAGQPVEAQEAEAPKTDKPPEKQCQPDIGCVTKLRNTHTNDTLSTREHPIRLPAITFPESVVQLMRGELGLPADGFPEALQKKVLKGDQPYTAVPGSLLPPADLDALPDYVPAAFIAIEAATLFDIEERPVLRAACALECVHAYSLVHDDLPCMDDDDLRRGRPTVHRAYDEATAVLAGDALQTAAFDIILHEDTHEDAEIRCELASRLSFASGARGMAGTVRLKRGAGAGWVTPLTSMKVLRERLWGCDGASSMSSTGATHGRPARSTSDRRRATKLPSTRPRASDNRAAMTMPQPTASPCSQAP